jgi:hypothetical protein
MRSIVADEWPSMERGNTTEAPRTLAFGERVRADMRALPLSSERERSAAGHAVELITEASEARQQLLFFTEPEIPTPLWVVIYVGIFVLVFLIALHYIDHPLGRLTALVSVTALLTVVVAVLAMLDRPFEAGVGLEPDALRHAITLLSVDTEKAVLRPCSAMRP